MKKLLSVLLAIVIIISIVPLGAFTFTASAEATTSGTTGDCTWTLDGTVLTISGSGAMENYAFGYSAPWGTDITKVNIEYGITSIGDYAFYYCDSLTSITIPDSVKSIGDSAFVLCDSLTRITIPDGVTSIGNSAFESCHSLTSIKIPDSVTSIGDYAFCNCYSLTSIKIPNGVTNIGDSVFSNCDLTSIKIPNSVTSIGDYAFSGCSSLTSITIPDSVTSIGDSAFNSCHSLTSITIPDSVTSISNGAFYSCGFTSVTIPDSVTSIGDRAFYYCGSLISITIPDSVTSIGDGAFGMCNRLISITIPDSVTSIGDSAFYYCNSLTDVWYTGSELDRQNITVGSYNNTCLTSATWHYNSCPVGASHNYDNACDTTCNVCGITRTVSDHIYNNNCDVDCNECGDIRTPSDHIYDNDCDATCNECGDVRTPSDHIYNNTCDTICNECGAIRTITHTYENNCDAECNICYFTRVPSDHIYNNNCDVDCNECGDIRTPSDHVYDNDCDATCNECGDVRTPSDHIYDNACDTSCNECGDIRTITHTYDSNCDADCNECGGVRTVPDHIYDNTCDTSCNECGDTRTITHIYDNNCDAECNACGLIRIPSNHIYDNACDASCNECGTMRTADNHTYNTDNICTECGYNKILEYITYRTLNNTITITDCNTSISGNFVIPSTINGCSVTSIGAWTFEDCDGLTSITIPNSVTSIGAWAFYDCDGLTSVYITDIAAWCNIEFNGTSSNPLYYADNLYLNGELITDVVIPNGIKKIPHYAFSCNSITSITIPTSVTSIGVGAFSYCSSLTSVYITDIAAWCNIEFNDTSSNPLYYADNLYLNGELVTNLVIPDGVTSIGGRVFYDCDSLTSVTIPDSVTNIGEGVFYDCDSLTSVTIPDSVTSIGAWAFEDCDGLTSVYITDIAAWCNIEFNNTFSNPLYYADNLYLNGELITDVVIPNGIKKIPHYAFSCNSITSITIPDSVTSIGEGAFSNCSSLTSVYITDIAAWCNIEFNNTFSNPLYCADNLYLNGELVTNLVIPDGVTSIGDAAFYDCDSLTSVTIPDSVTNIGEGVFYDCDSLTSITIPDSVTSIGSYAFCGCSSLTSVTIPDSVTSIGAWAFEDCDGLTSITIPDSVTSIGYDAFFGCYNLKNVYYRGGQTKKENITIDSGNSCLINATWHYNCCLGGASHKYDNECDVECNVCSYTRTITHNYEWIIDKQNTCGVDGYKHEECAVCGVIRNENTIIQATGNHNYQWVIDKQSNCVVDGYKHEECTVCHAKQNQNTVIDATGNHDYQWVIDKQNTCGIDGYKHEECTVCHVKQNQNTVIDATGSHTYIDEFAKYCSVCQAKRICDVCNGSGKDLFKVDCDNCTDGTVGSTKCTVCSGTGKYTENYCGSCGGNGATSNGTCSKCQGTGIGTTTVTCYYCNGKGRVSIKCSKCSGHGLVDVEGDCLNCLGEGNIDVYKITFNANGGTFEFSEYAISGHGKTLPTEIPTRTGYKFAGWGTTQKCGKQYAPGEEYTVGGDITLYALWYDLSACSTCNGSGKVAGECSWCGGVGRSSYLACSSCGSTRYNQTGTMGRICLDCGRSSFKTVTVTCEGCNGDGVSNKTCNTCSGSGGTIVNQETPVIISFTDITVTLLFKSGYEYSKDGVTWQESNVFTNLSPATRYTFYMRVGATDTTPFSVKSLGVSVTTDSSKQTLVPNAPTVQSFTSSSITLVAVDGCEYSKDGITWQSSNVFSGLSCGTEYTFYQRYKETTTTYVGQSSVGLIAKTDKGTPSKPSAPTLLSKTHNSVTLVATSGYEYSRDGVNWQSSNVFTGLDSETNYIFYQRKAETDKYYVSETSASLTVKTTETPNCTTDPSLHVYNNACDASCNVCGATRTVPSHEYSDAFDTSCNVCGAVREVPDREWRISPNITGVYNVTPNKTLSGFNKGSITVLDKNGKAVKYNDAKRGWPLVAGQTYTVKLNTEFDNINNLTWNLTKKADTIFTDTSSSGWYNDAVAYSVGAGLITGYGGTTKFGTADNIQRQDFVVILARLAGVDLANYQSNRASFADVPSGTYYENAILWAADCGITTGYNDGTNRFGVGDKVTREQLVTFLYRYAKYINGGVAPTVSAGAERKAKTYADYKGVTDYAKEAIIWALDKGVIKGQGGKNIAPGGNALRCEIAQIMYNIFLNDIF